MANTQKQTRTETIKKLKVMTTRILITAALIITMGAAHAAMSTSLIFTTSDGKELVQPTMPEETEEVLPFEVRQEMEKSQTSPASFQFDITSYSQPEEEEPLPFDLRTEFLRARMYQADSRIHIRR